ncbi:MAG TPA: hypothetical protein ENN49_07220 [Bacteroidales bacterium]|nr:hypothetical protein [Bacteroidales bacterium]
MSNIEKFIRQNIGEFEFHEMLPGHEERFMLRLKQKHRLLTIRSYLLAAATVAIIVAITGAISLYYNSHFGFDITNYFTSSESRQLYEVDAYYRSQLLRKYRSIEKIAHLGGQMLPSPEQLLGESIADKPQVKSEISVNPRSDVAVGAIVQSYQIRLETLEHLEQALKQALEAK